MSILFYIFLGIAIDVAIFSGIYSFRDKGPKMTYNEYLQKYGSVGDKYPKNYSNPNDYM